MSKKCVTTYNGQKYDSDMFKKFINDYISYRGSHEPLKTDNTKIEVWKGNWTRQDIQNNPNKVFLFGDNFEDAKTNYVPSSTQAVIRGLPNAIGISTKNNRGTATNSYLSDNQFEEVKKHIDEQIEKAIQSGKTIILPENGIGTGKAMLADKAPKIYNYLNYKLKELQNDNINQEHSLSNIYNSLGNKTESGNVQIKSVYQQSGIKYAKDISGIYSMRVNNSNKHFGNPFSSNEDIVKKDGLIKTNSTKESVEKYIEWILSDITTIEPERHNWIRQQLISGNLRYKPIVYYKELGEPSHANALDYLINNYKWFDGNLKKTINIYSTEKNGFESLSNFANRPFIYNGRKYNNVEQAFQYIKGEKFSNIDSIKTGNQEILKKIISSENPVEMKRLGRQLKEVDVKEWDKHSERIMKELLLESFKQNIKSKELLLSTGNATLTHTQEKGKWGILFPKLLMEVREDLRKNYQNDKDLSNRKYKTIQDVSESIVNGIVKDSIGIRKSVENSNVIIVDASKLTRNKTKDSLKEQAHSIAISIANKINSMAGDFAPLAKLQPVYGTNNYTIGIDTDNRRALEYIRQIKYPDSIATHKVDKVDRIIESQEDKLNSYLEEIRKQNHTNFDGEVVHFDNLTQEEQDTVLEQYRETKEIKKDFSNRKRPVTDNFTEYINHKESLLSWVIEQKNKAYKDIKNPKKDKESSFKLLQDLLSYEAELNEELENLRKRDVELLFQTLESELDKLNNTAFDVSFNNLNNLKTNINFLYSFITGTEYGTSNNVDTYVGTLNHPSYNNIVTKLNEVMRKYNQTLETLKDFLMKEDILYHNNIQKNDELSQVEKDSLFDEVNDINFFEEWFLGVGQSSNKEPLTVQLIKSRWEEDLVKKQAIANDYKNKLREIVNKFTNKDFNFIFETNDTGVRTGNLINKTSPLYRKELAKYWKIGRGDKYKGHTQKDIYQEKIQWLKDNTIVIDFRKLKSIKDLYGNSYSSEFIYSEEEMDTYEKELKDILGPTYDIEIAKVLSNLENFEHSKELLTDEKDILRINPFEFVKNYYSPNINDGIPFTNNAGNTSFVLPNLANISFIPKAKKFIGITPQGKEIYKDTGYYNEKFKDIENDPNKLEYWKLMTEIYSEHINPTYGNSQMSFAKIEADWTESVSNTGSNVGKAKKVFSEALKAYKTYWFEKGRGDISREGVVANYKDNTRKEIRDLENVLRTKSLQELKTMALENKLVNYSELNKEQLSKALATKLIMDNYSSDINKITQAMLDMTAVQQARQTALPAIEILFDYHKNIKDNLGKERKRSIDKLQNFIDIVIKNQQEHHRGTKGFFGKSIKNNSMFNKIIDKYGDKEWFKNMFGEKAGFILSDSEKQLFKYVNEAKKAGHSKDSSSSFMFNTNKYQITIINNKPVYSIVTEEGKTESITENQYEEAFQKSLDKQIENLGLDLNVAGLTQGIIKTIVLKSLGLNPIAGIFNRIEGKHTNMIMDQTGEYWTSGNITKANNFMAFSNIMKILPERMSPKNYKRYKELQKFQLLIDNLKLINDMKDILEQNADKGVDVSKLTNLYALAVDHPEFKNQGAILLSVFMDTKIKDVNGNEVPIFDGNEFLVYDNIDGILRLKPEYRTKENIENWENFNIDEANKENNHFYLTRAKIKTAVNRSQGNYDVNDTTKLSKHLFSRTMFLFKRWSPEHFMQRFSSGEGIDLTTGQKKMKGRYRYTMENNPALITTGIAGVLMSMGLGVGALGVAGISGFVAYRLIKNTIGNNKQIQNEGFNLLELMSFMKSILIGTLNYPMEMVNGKKVINNKYDGYSKTNLSEQEIGALRAVAKEIGVKLSLLSLMLLAKYMTWDDDDDENSTKRKTHNFIDNQMSKAINSLHQWQDPKSFVSDMSRSSFLIYLDNTRKLVQNIITLNTDNIGKDVLKVAPIPSSVVRVINPGEYGFNTLWEENYEFEKAQWQDTFIKDLISDGEHSAKKEYIKLRKDKNEEMKYQGYDKKQIQKILPKKDKGETYKDVLKEFKNL